MTREEFQQLIEYCKPSEFFYSDWTLYYPFDFANTFLPRARLHEAKGLRVYDGAKVFTDAQTTERKLYQLTDSKYLTSLITYTYPKGAAAENNKNKIQVSDHEVCALIEVSEDDSIEVFFKLGRDFKEFLYAYAKQNKSLISPSVVENTTYKTDIPKLKAIFNHNLVHYNMMEFVLRTIGINEAKTFQNNYSGKLSHLLKTNNIKQAKYSNQFGADDNKKRYTLVITPIQNDLDLSLEESITSIDIDKSKSSISFLYNNASSFITHQTNNDKPYVVNPIISNEQGKPTVDNEILKQVVEEVKKTGLTDKPTDQQNEKLCFADIAQLLSKKLENPFYSNVKMLIRVVQLGKPETPKLKSIDQIPVPQIQQQPQVTNRAIITNNTDDWEIGLDITIKEDGTVDIKHRVSENYLKNSYYWKNEIKLRGLDYDADELRNEITADFISAETEKSFYGKFIQQTKAFFSDKLGGYVEAIQATQKVTKNVWEVGAVNESIWWQNAPNEEYKQWPEYMHSPAIVGGATDGVIDEVIGIPMAIKGVYEIATDEKKRESLKGMFTKEGFGKLKDGLKEEVKLTLTDEDKGEHFVGQTTVAVVAMLTGFSIFSKGGKVSEVLDKATDGLKKFINPKVVKLYEDLKGKFKYKPENRKAFEDIIQNETQEGIEDIGENALQDAIEKAEIIENTPRWALGRKFEERLSNLFENSKELKQKIAEKIGLQNLDGFTKLKQVQIKLGDGTYFVADDLWFKKIVEDGKEKFEVIINETKLSNESPFTTNQKTFMKELKEGKVEFELRNNKWEEFEETQEFAQGSTLKINSITHTIGEGKVDGNFEITKFVY